MLLMIFGTVYMLWRLRPHRHRHEKKGATEGGTVRTVLARSCVALIPLIIAAAGGWPLTLAVIVAYETGTISSMAILVVTAHAGARAVRLDVLDRYGDAVAGALIVTVGVAVQLLRI